MATFTNEFRDALAAVYGYSVAILRRASHEAYVGAVITSIVLAVAALTLVFLSGQILGDRLWGGKAFHVMQMTRAGQQIHFYISEYGALQTGHLCAKYVDLTSGESVKSISVDGKTEAIFRCPKPIYAAQCGACTMIQENSDAGTLAAARRWLIQHKVREFFGYGQIVAMGVFAASVAAVVFIGSLVVLPPIRIILLSSYAFYRLFAILRRTALPPRLDEWSEESRVPDDSPIIAQITDLHLTKHAHAPYELRLETNPPKGYELERRLARVLDAVEAQGPQLVAFTGDLTDSGHSSEWASLRKSLARLKTVKFKSMALPGNHDVQITIVHSEDGGRFAPARADMSFESQQRNCFRELDETFDARHNYPCKVEVLHNINKVCVIALDSCRYESNWMLSNAVGSIGSEQLVALQAVLPAECQPLIVVLHHHVGWYKSQRRDVRDMLMCAVDGHVLLKLLAKYSADPGSPVLVLHGHKHMNLRGVYNGHGASVYVHGSASSTLGNCKTPTSPLDGNQYWVGVWLDKLHWKVAARVV